jgi:F-type H+-transporting ATPase subunit a
MSDTVKETLTLGERLSESLTFKTAFTIHLGGINIPITETVVTSWFVMALITVGVWAATRRMKDVPRGAQAVAEVFVDFANGFFKDQLGHHWKTFTPFLGSVFIYLLTANLISIISPKFAFGFEPPFMFKPPARDINTTAAFAVMTIVIVIVSGIRYKGVLGFLKSLFHPSPFMLPFNLVEYIIKPLSLALRLFGNILGAFILMELIQILIPVAIPPVFGLYFDLFDGLIQAVVFTFLSTIYIAEAIETHA